MFIYVSLYKCMPLNVRGEGLNLPICRIFQKRKIPKNIMVIAETILKDSRAYTYILRLHPKL